MRAVRSRKTIGGRSGWWQSPSFDAQAVGEQRSGRRSAPTEDRVLGVKAARTRTLAGERNGRSGQPREERIPGCDEPRPAHAARGILGMNGLLLGTELTDRQRNSSRPVAPAANCCCNSSTTSWTCPRSKSASSNWTCRKCSIETLVYDVVEALEAIQRGRYDPILMDCQIPEMDGSTAARELSQHVPIIALTANALKGERERCLEAGMDDYLTKPVEARQLRSKLEHYLSSNKS